MTSEFGRCTIDLPDELEEVVSALLWEADTTGLEVLPGEDGRLRIHAFFEGEVPVLSLPDGVRCLARDRVPDRDWLESYRDTARPLEVGRRFVLDPREPDLPEPATVESVCGESQAGSAHSRFRLRLPARRAFGTGSHATTQLVLESMERLAGEIGFADSRVLDVGCGTGVLAFAALLLGANEVLAYDLDPVSPLLAYENTALNHDVLGSARPILFAGRSSALDPRLRFDLILVNVLAGRIRDEIPELARHVAAEGKVVVSGLLSAETNRELERWRAQGLEVEHQDRCEEWSCVTLGAAP